MPQVFTARLLDPQSEHMPRLISSSLPVVRRFDRNRHATARNATECEREDGDIRNVETVMQIGELITAKDNQMKRFIFTSLSAVSLLLYLTVLAAWITSNVRGTTVSADYDSLLVVIVSSNG